MKIIYPFWLKENLEKKRFEESELPFCSDKYLILENKEIVEVKIEDEKD